jgi:hypothetical protein
MSTERHPGSCEKHGLSYRNPKALKRSAPINRVSTRRERQARRQGGKPKRDWKDARAKVEQEGCCRVCKRSGPKLEAAHTIGCEHDEPKTPGSKALYVHPDRIVPLCGPFPDGCHGDYDERHSLNLVHYMTIDEQVQAVRDAGGIAQAWPRLAPVDHRAEVQGVAA